MAVYRKSLQIPDLEQLAKMWMNLRSEKKVSKVYIYHDIFFIKTKSTKVKMDF